MMRKITNGKKLGVLSGMGPAAGAEFLRLLAGRVMVETDQDHPVVYMISDTQIPDRSTAILGLGPDPSEQIQADFDKLVELGADVLACPCNSAHYFIDRLPTPPSRPLIHIIESTVLAAQQKSPEGAWLVSTLGTRQSGLYQQYADKYGYRLFIPSETQAQQAQACINCIKGSDMLGAARIIEGLVQELWQEHDTLIMTACTELPLAYAASTLPKDREVSSLVALADACIAELFDEVEEV